MRGEGSLCPQRLYRTNVRRLTRGNQSSKRSSDDEFGVEAATLTNYTAGKPVMLSITPDRYTLRADGDDMAFVRVQLFDEQGVFCPTLDHELIFTVEGEGTFQAVCNGDATSLQPFTKPRMKLFNGELVVIVRSTETPGNIVLTVTDPKLAGLEKSITIQTRRE